MNEKPSEPVDENRAAYDTLTKFLSRAKRVGGPSSSGNSNAASSSDVVATKEANAMAKKASERLSMANNSRLSVVDEVQHARKSAAKKSGKKPASAN